jgi:hypothetical protein
MPASLTQDIKLLSVAWIRGAKPQELADMLSLEKGETLRAICRLRSTYGKKLFPYRKKAVAEGGYTRKKVLMIAKMWNAKIPLEVLAAKAGLNRVESVWGTIALLRSKPEYGEKLFPKRRT